MIRPRLAPQHLAWGLLLVTAAVASGSEPEAAGVVRITKPASPTVRAQSDGVAPAVCHQEMGGVPAGSCPSGDCQFGNAYGDCPDCYGKSHRFPKLHGHSGYQNEFCDVCGKKFGPNGHVCTGRDPMIDYFMCKFGFLIPTGCGGAGCPPFGRYARVYPQDVNYFDQRDGQVWAAQGYGVPIAVPLAPVVGHQYNYSWGTPSSRLTPISHVAPY